MSTEFCKVRGPVWSWDRQAAVCNPAPGRCLQAAIHEQVLQFPEGYETVVGERGLKLRCVAGLVRSYACGGMHGQCGLDRVAQLAAGEGRLS